MNAVAAKYTELWKGEPLVAHVPEHYTYSVVSKEMASRGLVKEGTERRPARRSDHHAQHVHGGPEVRPLR